MAEDRIRLTGIRAFGRHGVLERERRDGQEFVVDVVLHLETSAAAMSDDLADTVDYGGIAAQIHSVLTGPPVGLLETLAERIAALALAPLLVDAVDVVVHKPQAPVSVPFHDISVEIHRSREYPPALEVAQVLAALAGGRVSEPVSAPVPRVLPALEVPPGVLHSGPMPVVAPVAAVPLVPPPPPPAAPSAFDAPETVDLSETPTQVLEPAGDGASDEAPVADAARPLDEPLDPRDAEPFADEPVAAEPSADADPDATDPELDAVPFAEPGFPEPALEEAGAELPDEADAVAPEPDPSLGLAAAEIAAAELAVADVPAIPAWHPIGSVAPPLPPVPAPPLPAAPPAPADVHVGPPADVPPADLPPVDAPPAPPADVDPAPAGQPSADWTEVLDRALDQAPDAPVDVVLALGSNLGPSQEILRHAVADLSAVPGLEVTEVAPLARTAAVGGPEQPDFLNTVVLARTTLSPRALLAACQVIETSHGRVRSETWGPRTLDIDLIVHGATIAAADDLELPHPRASQRAFVLQPWAQVAPDAVLPGLGGGPVAALATTAPDRDGIRWMALDWWTAPTD
jgi:2-amino-4-hydroxy-6-hydroxymethyldihydropteridine diphosphokinase/dihydroneopterin aldolase